MFVWGIRATSLIAMLHSSDHVYPQFTLKISSHLVKSTHSALIGGNRFSSNLNPNNEQ